MKHPDLRRGEGALQLLADLGTGAADRREELVAPLSADDVLGDKAVDTVDHLVVDRLRADRVQAGHQVVLDQVSLREAGHLVAALPR